MTGGQCTICLNRDGYKCRSGPFDSYDATFFDCDVCGRYLVSRSAVVSLLREDDARMTPIKRAVLSHHVRQHDGEVLLQDMWTTDRLDNFLSSDPKLPNPGQQATNIIRMIGNIVSETGDVIETMSPSLPAVIGSPSSSFAFNLLVELKDRGLLTALTQQTFDSYHVQDVNLTLAGWELFENERQGQISGSYGFVALKFGDAVLDPLLQDHIKPAVREIGYGLVDLRDVARAGVIDNLLRMQIRDSAFVLVDLTHENAGAYWEAGYAEGLGKPVLYLCERGKFEEKKTHFDTNHCTTILWDTENTDNFRAELQATIRRSLIK